MYSAGILPDLPYDIVDEILTKMKRLEIEHPLLANALQENEVRII